VTSRQLEYFRAVARELHFTRAAERLHVAQPALSQQIRKLEQQLGLSLFDRDNHRVELTAAGTALLEHAERILSDLAAVEQEMHDWTAGTRGLIRLGTARALATPLARLVGRFSGVFPGIEIELREESTLGMIEDLRTGRLDAATLARIPRFDAGLEHRLLGSEPLVLVAGLDTPLARRRRIQVARLDGLDLILYGRGSAVRDVITAALEAAGATPRIRFETREYRTARALASEGLAAAILPLTVAEEPGQPVHIVRLDPEPMWSASLAWPAGRRPSPALAVFIEFVEAHFARFWPG
jgi:DNA-binding transcriptional LysR family regulator